MLMKLIPVDDLPLKLGRKIPTAAEKAKTVAQMEACAAALDTKCALVEWVPDERKCWGDYDHPAAEMPDPMAVVAAEFEKMCGSFPISRLHPYAAGRVGVDIGRPGGDRTAAVKYLFEEGNLHIKPIAASDLYDIKPTTIDRHHLEQRRLNDEMRAMADRISCIPPGTVEQTATQVMRDQQKRAQARRRLELWWQ